MINDWPLSDVFFFTIKSSGYNLIIIFTQKLYYWLQKKTGKFGSAVKISAVKLGK